MGVGLNFKILRHGALILSVSMLVAGCSIRSVIVDVDSPKYFANKSLVIPKEGITITSPIHLVGRVDILGEGPIFLKGKGRIVVEENSQAALRNVSIEATEIEASDGEMPVRLISIGTGKKTSLSMEDGSIVVDIPYEKGTSDAPWDQSPKYWVVGISDDSGEQASQVTVNVRNNRFLNRNAYSAGALGLWQDPQNEASAALVGEITGNTFEGFHGVITANKMKGYLVSGNRLVRNSFANIFVSGENVDVADNKVYYPGNGTTGDGIAVIGRFVDSKIEGNTIFAGSCYGVLIKGDEISNLSIEGNSIANGVTTAIQIEGSTKKAKNITVRDNTMSGNYGFAVTLREVENSTIENNFFSGNAKGFPSQVYIEKSPGTVLSDNLSAIVLTPDWAKGLELYRSHVKADDSSFTLPGAQAN